MGTYTHAIFLEDGSFAGWIKYESGFYETPTRFLGTLAALDRWIDSVKSQRIAVIAFNCLNDCHWERVMSHNPKNQALKEFYSNV